jgi:hypothetical protein
MGSNISISEAQKEEVLMRRRDAIISEIYNCFFSADDPSQVTMIDIFNALMLLVQTSIMFVLVPFDKNKQTISDNPAEYIKFYQHPINQGKIEEAVRQAKKDNAFFEIFGVMDKRLIVLQTSGGASHADSFHLTVLQPRDKIGEDICGYQLGKILDKNVYSTRFGDSFLSNIQKIVSDCKNFTMKKEYERLPKENKKEYDSLFEKFKDSLEKGYSLLGIKYDGVINQAYKKSEKSLNFIHELNKSTDNKKISLSLPNFLLFVRNYSCIDEEPRDRYYNYDLCILICEKQESDIREYFNKLNANKNYYFHSYEKKLENTEKHYQNILKEVHSDFWDKLEKSKIDVILKALKSPFKEGSYSMSDPCFMSGLIQFRDLKINGGIHRSLHEYGNSPPAYKKLSEGKKEELLRIVAVYYLFLGMASYIKEDALEDIEEKDIYPSVMLCPVTVGGAVFGVMSYVTFKGDSEAKTVMEYSAAWRQNYHMFSAGHRRFKRNVRNYMWRSYVVFISYLFGEQVKLTNENRNYDICIFRENLNKKLELLTRFFSFSGVQIDFKVIEKGDTGDNILSFGDIDTVIFHANKSFFSTPYGLEKPIRFVNIEEIKQRIKDEFVLGFNR